MKLVDRPKLSEIFVEKAKNHKLIEGNLLKIKKIIENTKGKSEKDIKLWLDTVNDNILKLYNEEKKNNPKLTKPKPFEYEIEPLFEKTNRYINKFNMLYKNKYGIEWEKAGKDKDYLTIPENLKKLLPIQKLKKIKISNLKDEDDEEEINQKKSKVIVV
jgi:hypothetical protein